MEVLSWNWKTWHRYFQTKTSTSNKLKNVTWPEFLTPLVHFSNPFLIQVTWKPSTRKCPSKPKRRNQNLSSRECQKLGQTTLNNYGPPETVYPFQYFTSISSQQPGQLEKGETTIITAVVIAWPRKDKVHRERIKSATFSPMIDPKLIRYFPGILRCRLPVPCSISRWINLVVMIISQQSVCGWQKG